MSWTVHIRATHIERKQVVERSLDTCPAILGRDAALAAFVLEGDDSVSKVHASVDVRGSRLLVRDVRSTNGTFTSIGRVEADRWVDVGPAEGPNEIRIGGWRLHVRAMKSAFVTLPEDVPFGLSESTTTGHTGGAALLTSFPEVVDRLSEPVYAFRVARKSLDQVVATSLASVAKADRAMLARTLSAHYPELREELEQAAAQASPAAPRIPVAPAAAPAAAALGAVKELSIRYAGSDGGVATPDLIVAFSARLRSGLDAFVGGLVQALAGVNAYMDEMSVSPAPSADQLPRTNADLIKAVFHARSDGSDGSEIVRRAFNEIAIHQVASFNAILSGVRELLGELSPEAIESAVSRELGRESFWKRVWGRLRPARRLLEVYRRRHRDLSTEENTRFALIFGRRFADEYHAIVRETRSSSLARGTPPALPSPPSAPAAPARVDARGGTVPLAAPIAPRGGSPTGTVPFAPALRPGGPGAGGDAQ